MKEYVCSLIGINPTLECVFDNEDIVATAAFIFSKDDTYRVYRANEKEMIEHIVVQSDCEILVDTDVFSQQFVIEPELQNGYKYMTKDIPFEPYPKMFVYDTRKSEIIDCPLSATKTGQPGDLVIVERAFLPSGESSFAELIRERYQDERYATAKEDLHIKFVSDHSEVKLIVNIHKYQVFQITFGEENTITLDIGNIAISATGVWVMKHFQVLPKCLYGYQYIGSNPLFNPSQERWTLYNKVQKRIITEEEELEGKWVGNKNEWVMVYKINN